MASCTCTCFCDDWKLFFDAANALDDQVAMFDTFERASGQVFNRPKTAWMPSRALTASEEAWIAAKWQEPNVVTRHKSLGGWFGPGASKADLLHDPLVKLRHRLSMLRSGHASLSTKLLAWNVFAAPLLTYVMQLCLVSRQIINEIRELALTYFERVRWAPFPIFCNAKALFKMKFEYQDPFSMNVAALIATAWRLGRAGGI